MTRHGLIQPPAAGAQPPATDPRVPMVLSEADRAASACAEATRLRGGVTERSVRVHRVASRGRSRHRRHQPQTKIPIAIDCGPRVPAWEAFVRLPVSSRGMTDRA